MQPSATSSAAYPCSSLDSLRPAVLAPHPPGRRGKEEGRGGKEGEKGRGEEGREGEGRGGEEGEKDRERKNQEGKWDR